MTKTFKYMIAKLLLPNSITLYRFLLTPTRDLTVRMNEKLTPYLSKNTRIK